MARSVQPARTWVPGCLSGVVLGDPLLPACVPALPGVGLGGVASAVGGMPVFLLGWVGPGPVVGHLLLTGRAYPRERASPGAGLVSQGVVVGLVGDRFLAGDGGPVQVQRLSDLRAATASLASETDVVLEQCVVGSFEFGCAPSGARR